MEGIDLDGPDPLYVQVADLVRGRIADGTYEIGKRMPTEAALAEEFSVARPTVQKALALLVDEGLVRKVQGRGTFAIAKPEPKS